MLKPLNLSTTFAAACHSILLTKTKIAGLPNLLGQIDIDELKVTEVLMPEKKAQLIRILENLKEYDNPVIYDSNLKIE